MSAWLLTLIGIAVGLALMGAVILLVFGVEIRGGRKSWFSRPSGREDTGISVGTPNGPVDE